MVRLKFLLFALLAVGLWATQLWLLSPGAASRAVELAAAHARAAAHVVSSRLAERRIEVGRVALRVASSPRLAQAVRAGSSDRASQIAALAREGAPEALRSSLIVGVSSDSAASFANAEGSALTQEGLDPALSRAGAEGTVQDVGGVAHAFVSFPAPGDAKPALQVIIGAPLVSAAEFDAAARDTRLASVALLRDGKLVAEGGTEKGLAARGAKLLAPGRAEVIERGPSPELFGLPLPLLTGKGGAPSVVGAREAVQGTPFELFAGATVRPAMTSLGAYQLASGAAGLLLIALSGVWFVLIGRGVTAGAQRGAPAPPKRASGQRPQPKREDGTAIVAHEEAFPPLPQPMPESAADALAQGMAELPPPPDFMAARPMSPEAEPPPDAEPITAANALPRVRRPADPYGGAAPLTEASGGFGDAFGAPEPPTSAGDPFAFAPPPPPPDEAPPAPAEASADAAYGFAEAAVPPPPADDTYDDSDRTRAVPMDEYPEAQQSAGEDDAPMADPASVFSADPNEPPPEDAAENPDATRVTAIPQELLEASQRSANAMVAAPRSSTKEIAPPPSVPMMAQVAPAAADVDEQHFQEVFREFVTTREQCGEPADGLTFDKFVLKLRKNREQLQQKYSCRTVRFQVYVKEGKAALKATPIKDA